MNGYPWTPILRLPECTAASPCLLHIETRKTLDPMIHSLRWIKENKVHYWRWIA